MKSQKIKKKKNSHLHSPKCKHLFWRVPVACPEISNNSFLSLILSSLGSTAIVIEELWWSSPLLGPRRAQKLLCQVCWGPVPVIWALDQVQICSVTCPAPAQLENCPNDVPNLQDRCHIARSSAVLVLRDQLLSGLFLVIARNRRQAVPEMIKERKCQAKPHTTAGKCAKGL